MSKDFIDSLIRMNVTRIIADPLMRSDAKPRQDVEDARTWFVSLKTFELLKQFSKNEQVTK